MASHLCIRKISSQEFFPYDDDESANPIHSSKTDLVENFTDLVENFKSLFTNIQKQYNMLRSSLLFKKITIFTGK